MKFLFLSVVVSFSSLASDCLTVATYLNFKQHVKLEAGLFPSKSSICLLANAIIEQESNFNPKAFNPEKTGSYGLMQIQCLTAKRLGLEGSCDQLFNPHLNIFFGLKLLHHLQQRYTSLPDIIASYNAGRVIRKDNDYINAHYVKGVLSKYIKRSKRSHLVLK